MITDNFLKNLDKYLEGGLHHENDNLHNNTSELDLVFKLWVEEFIRLHRECDKFIRSTELDQLERELSARTRIKLTSKSGF